MDSRARDQGRKEEREKSARIDADRDTQGERAVRPIYIEGGPRNGSRRHEGRQR